MKRNFWIPTLVPACFAWGLAMFAMFAASPAQAAPPGESPGEERELIVLLAAGPGAPRPEEVVDHARRGEPLPAGLGIGNPREVRFVLAERASGELLAEIEADPDSPRARLERYVVFRYPAQANLEAIREALLRNPHVLAVEENLPLDLASTNPNDPMFPSTGSTPPDQYQWGSFTLNLPNAWDYTRGHAYVGIVDTGIDPTHPDLVGNFRQHLSWDFGYDDNNVSEGQAQQLNGQLTFPDRAGHGTHVAGIVGATANNGIGVAGACWGCSLMIAKASTLANGCVNGDCFVYNATLFTVDAAEGVTGMVDRGAQVINMSFRSARRNCATSPNVMCDALAYATQRDVAMVASSGNGGGNIGFPAHDPRVLAAGGIIPDGSFWGTCDPAFDTTDCPSNDGPDQEVVAPARQVLSTFYRGLPYSPTACSETSTGSGYGPCTGTSMSSPYVASLAGLARSVNPLLSQSEVQTLLRSTASFGTFHDNEFGFGIANALAAVETALGRAGGTVVPNRLTPLFSLYSSTATDSFYTTVPQMVTAAQAGFSYEPTGPLVAGYDAFPGAPAPCPGCRIAPGASVYVFTGERAPFAGAAPLVPLYRLTRSPATSARDSAYAVDAAGITSLRNLNYQLDGIEGYIHPLCTPEPGCIPAGAVRLYRYYNASRDDFAIFPESELAQMQALGYAPRTGFAPVLGYVYPNADADGDRLVNGFEGLLGTDAAKADTDCDGTSDGNEVLLFPPTDPRGSSCDQPPVPQFTFFCNGRTCTFDGSASTDDKGIVSHGWSFGDGTTGSGPTVTHTYATVSTFTATLTVTDTIGQARQISQSVTTEVDNPPHASFYVVCVGRTCSVDAEASTDDFGITNYLWSWGDGQTTSGTNSAPSHTYAANGTYTINLTVSDIVGQTASTSQTVSFDQAPVASFTINCIGRSCDVDASASSDDLGIASYSWDWDDEALTTGGPLNHHDYGFDGTFTVRLTVTDTSGNTAGASRTVTVFDNPPHASFFVVCVGRTCSADAEASTDDFGITNYLWNWGDGQTTSGTNSAPSHVYAADGTYTITLTVSDRAGQTASASHTVTVSLAPTASFTISCVARTCDVDASASTGSIVDYLWDWNDEALSTGGPLNSHTYGWDGTFTVRLTVTDSAGNTTSTTRTVTVTAGGDPAPTASFTISCTGRTCNVDASASTDNGTIVDYIWDWDDEAVTSGGPLNSHTYGWNGTFTVRLTVVDNAGGTGHTTRTVTVSGP